jgi:ATP-dependent RNA helicase DDX52/ROK1
MAGFRRGEIWVIITTDLLARGVDFRGLNGVVNYDVPTSAAAYVHRAGRTGRAGRKGGVVITLYTKEDVPFIKPVANVIAASEKARGEGGNEGSSVQQWLLDALPTPSKRDKKNLKQRGLEIRRPGVKGAMISTKAPGHNRKGAWNQSKRREPAPRVADVEDIEFTGFKD